LGDFIPLEIKQNLCVVQDMNEMGFKGLFSQIIGLKFNREASIEWRAQWDMEGTFFDLFNAVVL